MKSRALSRFLFSAVFAVLLATSSSAFAQVLKVVLDDTINPVTDEFLGRALDQAKAAKAQAVLIDINTPGGLVDSTRGIIEKFFASPIPIIVYVTPSGSRSASAGFFILEAADVAAMAPGTNTGAAHPVMGGGEKMDDVMKAKVENDLAAFMRSIANKRGRNVQVAESAVRESKSFTEQEALSQHLVDYLAPTEQDLFRQIAAKPIHRFDGSTITLDLTRPRSSPST
jgi:membrane-bound serine protease (ClpP class)